jgi:plasmid stabilization system protein ParE
MKVRFLKPAQSELDDAVEWYDSQSFGLGTQFLDDLDRAVRRIVSYPLSCPEIEPNLRRCWHSYRKSNLAHQNITEQYLCLIVNS